MYKILKKNGQTLFEVIFVFLIIGSISVISYNFKDDNNKINNKSIQSDIENIEISINLYKVDNNELPIESSIIEVNDEILEELNEYKDDGSQVHIINTDKLLEGKYIKQLNNKSEKFYISLKSNRIIYPKGFELNGKKVYTNKDQFPLLDDYSKYIDKEDEFIEEDKIIDEN